MITEFRLESYRACPFFFFVSHVLKLEPRDKPAEGLDARQLGNIYHQIFEELYQAAPANPLEALESEAAMQIAVEKAWEAVRGARRGRFAPHPPPDGCPAYCPATGFCWQHRRGHAR
jgi:RecB family exonuclease